MALYHKWNVKNGFAYVLIFFSLISDGLGSVVRECSRLMNVSTVKSRAVDRSTIQFWNFLAKGHST